MSKRPGTLYIVATPIGNLNDTSPRVIEILKHVHIILCEDTRTSGYFSRHFNIETPLLAFHEHNERELAELIIMRVQQGEDIALISDAGTPLISDPGYPLIQLAYEYAIPLVSVPGPCALIAALAVSGQASHRFSFEGFLPKKPAARRQKLLELRAETRTMIFYESPHRIEETLADMVTVLGGQRSASVVKEISKIYERSLRMPLQELQQTLAADPYATNGEYVVIVAGLAEAEQQTEQLKQQITIMLKYLPPSQAAAALADLTAQPRKEIYRLAVEINQIDP